MDWILSNFYYEINWWMNKGISKWFIEILMIFTWIKEWSYYLIQMFKSMAESLEFVISSNE